MPEYLAPGVFVEEVSFRARAIDGVDTTTAGFIGPCRTGPVAGVPVLIHSLSEFVERYGDAQPLHFGVDGGARQINDLHHAVAGFFAQGGNHLFVSRVYRPVDGGAPPDLAGAFPQILQRMDEQLDWTRSLGDAFLAQETQLMDHVQQLRRRAQALSQPRCARVQIRAPGSTGEHSSKQRARQRRHTSASTSCTCRSTSPPAAQWLSLSITAS